MEPANRRYTPAQLRALDWLPNDGSWGMKPGRVRAAIDSLWAYHRALIAAEYGRFGPRGALCWRHRLTEKGIAERRRLTGRKQVQGA